MLYCSFRLVLPMHLPAAPVVVVHNIILVLVLVLILVFVFPFYSNFKIQIRFEFTFAFHSLPQTDYRHYKFAAHATGPLNMIISLRPILIYYSIESTGSSGPSRFLQLFHCLAYNGTPYLFPYCTHPAHRPIDTFRHFCQLFNSHRYA